MSWPGSGDPYYTQEGGDRRNYYSVNAVPDLVVDGNFWQDNSTALTAQVMDDALAIPAFVELSSFFTVDDEWNQIDEISLLSFDDSTKSMDSEILSDLLNHTNKKLLYILIFIYISNI